MPDVQTQTHKAFTLVEVVVTMAILAIVAVAGTSPILNHYRTTVVDSELSEVVSRLQRARQQSISNDGGDSYGVKFLSDRYVLFQGTTYSAGNSTNKEYGMDTNLLVLTTYTGDTVVFENFTGRTNASGTIQLRAFGITKTITINELGIVESIV